MATFTKIPDTETPVVSVNPLNKIAKINDNVYGGFTEYVACLYRISWSMRLTYQKTHGSLHLRWYLRSWQPLIG